MIRKAWLILATVALSGLLVLAACGDDDDDDDGGDATPDPAQVAEVEDVGLQMLNAAPDDEAAVDFFAAHLSANGLAIFGFETAEDCAADAESCVGEPFGADSMSGTDISGDVATTTGIGPDGQMNLKLVREDDLWKLEGFAVSAEIPEGTTVVDVTAIDYGFEWDPEDVGDGDVAFTFTNDGEELHEMALVSVADDFDIEVAKEFAQTEEGQQGGDPPGVTGFAGHGFSSPGLSGNVVLEEPLAPGNYALICTIPDAEGTPHVVLNMYSEFTVE